MQERTMWKPSVKAICSRAASRFDSDAASGSRSSGGMCLRLAPRTGAFRVNRSRLALRAVAPDQRVGGAVVAQLRLGGRLQLGDDRLRQNLAQLHSPLVEGIDPPDRPLGEDAVLVE